MRSLSLPDVTEPDDYTAVLEQRVPRLDDQVIVNALALRFAQYRAFAPEFRHFPDRDPGLNPHLGALKGLYKSTTAAAQGILSAVDAIRPKRCPYCGNPRKPATKDHYLPQSEYQEFSLFAPNLVPACWECNHTKLSNVWDEVSGERLFLHPYYDKFMDKEFVHLDIVPDAVKSYAIPLFQFRFNWPEATDAQIRTCQHHFDKLGIIKVLSDYYGDKLRSLHRKTRSTIEEGQAISADSLKNDLVKEEMSDSGVLGLNCWEAILNRAIVKNSQLLEFLVTAMPTRSEPLYG